MTMTHVNDVKADIRQEKKRPITLLILIWRVKWPLLGDLVAAAFVLAIAMFVASLLADIAGVPFWLCTVAGVLLVVWIALEVCRPRLRQAAQEFWEIFTDSYRGKIPNSYDIPELGEDPVGAFYRRVTKIEEDLPVTVTFGAWRAYRYRIALIATDWENLLNQEAGVFTELAFDSRAPKGWLKLTATAAQRESLKDAFIVRVEGPQGWIERLRQIHETMMDHKAYEKALLDELRKLQ